MSRVEITLDALRAAAEAHISSHGDDRARCSVCRRYMRALRLALSR